MYKPWCLGRQWPPKSEITIMFTKSSKEYSRVVNRKKITQFFVLST